MGYKLKRITIRQNNEEKQIRPKITYVRDYATQIYTTTPTNSQYVYGVCFTAKNNCTLKKVEFLGGENGSTGTLYINQGTLMTDQGTSYQITTLNSTGGKYTLTTEYQLTANTDYCIGFKFSGTGTNFSNNNNMTGLYPIDGTNIKFNYGTYSNTSSTFTNMCYYIAGLGTNN